MHVSPAERAPVEKQMKRLRDKASGRGEQV